jgi:uncharacterized RDD family membrane protein YckC
MQKPTQVVGRRVVAFVIDFAILALVIAVGWYALTKNDHAGSCGGGGGFEINGQCRGFTETSHRTIWVAIIALVAIAIFFVMQGLTGRTPGKAIVGIKVVNREGNRPGILRAMAREFLWIVDVWGVALVTALVSANNQRVGDMVAGTYVVDRNFAGALGAPQAGGAAISAPPPSGEPVGAPPQQQ